MALDLEGQGQTAVAPRRSVVVHDLPKVAVGPPVASVGEPLRQSWAAYDPQQPLAEAWHLFSSSPWSAGWEVTPSCLLVPIWRAD
jgi:hypothetical protein